MMGRGVIENEGSYVKNGMEYAKLNINRT